MRCKVARIHESSDKGIENRLRLLPWSFKDRRCATQIGSRRDDINFLIFRLYGPEPALFKKTWTLPDVDSGHRALLAVSSDEFKPTEISLTVWRRPVGIAA
jgi:hypothetical protein